MADSSSVKVLLVFLHGLGDTGKDLRDFLRLFPLPSLDHRPFAAVLAEAGVELLCPTAPVRKYSLHGGQMTNAWFDRRELSPAAAEDIVGIDASIEQLLQRDLAEHIAAGYKIILAGHSQGGGLILHFLRRPRPSWLLGIFTSGSFLAEQSLVYSSGRLEEYRNMPLYLTHGTSDSLVLFEWGQSTAERLTELGLAVNFVAFEGVEHEISDAQLERLLHWIKEALPAVAAEETYAPISFRIEQSAEVERCAKIIVSVPPGAEEQLSAMPVFACGGSFQLRPVATGTLEIEAESSRPDYLAREIVARLNSRYMAPAPADVAQCSVA